MKWSLGHKMPSLLHVVKLSMHTMHVMHVAGNAEDDDDEDDAAFISFRGVDDVNLMNHVEPALCERPVTCSNHLRTVQKVNPVRDDGSSLMIPRRTQLLLCCCCWLDVGSRMMI